MAELGRRSSPAGCSHLASRAFAPCQGLVVEAPFEGRLDDLEIGRDVEIGWGVEAEVPDVQQFPVAPVSGVTLCRRTQLDARQDRIPDTLERLRDQGRADRARRLARPE